MEVKEMGLHLSRFLGRTFKDPPEVRILGETISIDGGILVNLLRVSWLIRIATVEGGEVETEGIARTNDLEVILATVATLFIEKQASKYNKEDFTSCQEDCTHH